MVNPSGRSGALSKIHEGGEYLLHGTAPNRRAEEELEFLERPAGDGPTICCSKWPMLKLYKPTNASADWAFRRPDSTINVYLRKQHGRRAVRIVRKTEPMPQIARKAFALAAVPNRHTH